MSSGLGRVGLSTHAWKPANAGLPTQVCATTRVSGANMMSMGIAFCDAMMLWKASKRGVAFDRVLTVGRQSLYLHRHELTVLRSEYREVFGSSSTPLDNYRWGDYSDEFLRGFLQASFVAVLDMSAYEGADTIHDMNTPVPENWHGQYDAIIDGGSLEHIFNIPCAFANLGNLLKVDGALFITTPANNQMGHGFYQFSPELMFRVFSEANGFSVPKVLLCKGRYPDVHLTQNHKLYEVVDPKTVGMRVGLVSTKPVTMMVETIKLRDAEMFASPILQSDYVAMWKAADKRQVRSDSRGLAAWCRVKLIGLLKPLPIRVRAPIEGTYQKRKLSLRNRKFYRRQRWQS